MTDYNNLTRFLIDFIQEQQAKLGYMKEKIRLYYPLGSLNHMLGTSCDVGEMTRLLKCLPKEMTDVLGDIRVSNIHQRFCLEIPEQGSEYVHEHTDEASFIYALVDLMRNHGTTKEQVLSLFEKTGREVEYKQMNNDEFDFYVRFLHDENDCYFYCFKEEGKHLTYHRFMPADYVEFDF